MTSNVLIGVAASAVAGAATELGALPLLMIKRNSPKAEDSMLGFAAGVMMAASFPNEDAGEQIAGDRREADTNERRHDHERRYHNHEHLEQ